ncbi:MAG TPA: hypothetical protein EYN07_00625 [Flavobacteriaceae bacterium]|nr:hypothetical protein [Flavobacteriaceae bacterium]HIN97719.1 hypothetical protein [Flavobacteriaceae bacterium]
MKQKPLIFNILGFICAICCLATGWMWVYYINLVTALPALLLGLWLTRSAQKLLPNNRFSKINYVLFGIALVVSFTMLIMMLLR